MTRPLLHPLEAQQLAHHRHPPRHLRNRHHQFTRESSKHLKLLLYEPRLQPSPPRPRSLAWCFRPNLCHHQRPWIRCSMTRKTLDVSMIQRRRIPVSKPAARPPLPNPRSGSCPSVMTIAKASRISKTCVGPKSRRPALLTLIPASTNTRRASSCQYASHSHVCQHDNRQARICPGQW